MGHTITSLGKISKFYVQNIWQVVRWWHHQLTHLHIHIDWSRNVLWKFAKLQNVITSLFFNRFSSGFHYYVWKFLLVFLKFKLNLFRIPPLSFDRRKTHTTHWTWDSTILLNGIGIKRIYKTWMAATYNIPYKNIYSSWLRNQIR